ncbi:UDP-N-acetylglucosamine 2-epimerase [Vandammella animalimorsus]|uniref:UDP-N-acetylglucosamine 2-epimerase n=1 Tax=Vandammella animalimorsus TaxID=2029117 RepID=UPI00325B7843
MPAPSETRPYALVFIGTKAQFIKTAPVLSEMDRQGLAYRLIYTGQHSETFDLLEKSFQTQPPDETIVPSFEADTHVSFLRWTLRFWSVAVRRIRSPDWRHASVALVHGDTASALFGALAARLAGVPVAHIEAGLRSARLLEPFPEELIRRWVAYLVQLHFAPDTSAVENLRHIRSHVVNTEGNTLRDALRMTLQQHALHPEGGYGGYGVVSLHRNENLSQKNTFEQLMREVAETAAITPLIFVLHPATRAKLTRTGWDQRLSRVSGLRLVPRMDYPDFIKLLLGASFLLTDGGSNQEEAAMMGLPTFLLRRETERSDGLGDVVKISGLAAGEMTDFARKNSGRRWVLRNIPEDSPSKIITNELTKIFGITKK